MAVQLALPPLTGKSEVRFDLSGLPEACIVTKSFERQRFTWEGNHLGITAEIYPPYEPVRVEGKTVFVVSRRYTMNGFGLWDGIRALNRSILAAPIQIRYTTAAGEGVWSGARVALDSKNSTPQQAVFTATATSRAVQVKTVSTVEFDGCMKVEMELLPGREPTEIQQLWIDIPLKNDEAPLFHEVSATGPPWAWSDACRPKTMAFFPLRTVGWLTR
jgi:Family of unknown function (DUF6067)